MVDWHVLRGETEEAHVLTWDRLPTGASAADVAIDARGPQLNLIVNGWVHACSHAFDHACANMPPSPQQQEAAARPIRMHACVQAEAERAAAA